MRSYGEEFDRVVRERRTEMRVRGMDAVDIVALIHSFEDVLDKLTEMLDDMQYRVEDAETMQEQRDIVVNAVSDMMKEIANVR